MNHRPRSFLFLLVLLQSFLLHASAYAQEQVWLGDMDLARTRAQADEQQILVVFDQPNCPWCVKLERDTLASANVVSILRDLTLVKLDITENPDLAAQYKILGVPHSLLLDSDNSLLGQKSGFLPADAYQLWIEQALDPEARRPYQLPSDDASLQAWRELLAEMGKDGSSGIRDKILKRESFPAVALVTLLKDEQLKIRLGALDVLEFKAGTSFDYDPWIYPLNEAQYDALGKWEQWAGKDSASVNAGQTTLDLKRLTQNLIAGDERQAANAAQLLHTGGEQVRKELRQLRLSQTNLPERATRQLRKVEYAIQLKSIGANAPVRIANSLMFGSEDAQLGALRDLKTLGKHALPIVKDFFESDNALVRETAIETALAVNTYSVMDTVAEHLKEETNKNVIQSTLRTLASIKTPAASEVLVSKLDSEDEDVLIVALSSLADHNSPFDPSVLKPLLKDERWRVRARALEVIQKRSLKALNDDVRPLVEDEDSFVSKLALEIYTYNAGAGAVDLLEKYFLKDPSMRTSILSSFEFLQLPLPLSILEQIAAEDDPLVLLGYMPVLAEMNERGVSLLLTLSRNDNPDVVAGALEGLAGMGISNSAVMERIIEALEEDNAGMAYVILSNLVPSTQSSSGYSYGPPKATNTKKLVRLRAAVRPWLEYEGDEKVREYALQKLMLMGEPNLVDDVLENYDSLSAQSKLEIVTMIGEGSGEDTLPLLKRMLRDNSQSVRVRIVETLFSNMKNPNAMEMVFAEALSKESPLTLKDILGWEFFGIASDLNSREASQMYIKWINNFIKSDRVDANIVGLMMLSGQMQDSIAQAIDTPEVVTRFLDSPNVYCRRAAWYALSQRDEIYFKKIMHRCVLDDSALVRMVAPTPYINDYFQWEQMLDADTSYEVYSYKYYSSRSNLSSKSTHIKALNTLMNDPDYRVRMFAFMAVVKQRLSYDPQRLADTIMAHEDRTTPTRWLAGYIMENYKRMDETHLPLVPFIKDNYHTQETLNNVYRHFSKFEGYEGPTPESLNSETSEYNVFESLFGSSSSGGEEPTVIPLESSNTEVDEETAETSELQIVGTFGTDGTSGNVPFAEGEKLPEITVVYFSDPSCQDCARVTRWLDDLSSAFPSLVVRRQNIRHAEAVRMNEALSEYFDLPTVERLVAPTVFASSGALVRTEITPVSLRMLIQESAHNEDVAWLEAYGHSYEEAGAQITERFKTMTIGVVLLAGLVDGINPCAFATIVFLLSYLQVARRGRKETLLAGGVYAAAVFVTYFLIGLGLLEALIELGVTQKASWVLNILMALLVFVIMVLQIRDAALALKGKAREMSLQLPDFLKKRIRKVIRENTRTRNILLGSLIMGVTVSLLELACTGQVYAPTILYVVQQDVERARALFYLAAYNFAFIAPLLIVLGATWFGLTNDKLQNFFQRHIVTAKIGMALFFMLLFALFTASLV